MKRSFLVTRSTDTDHWVWQAATTNRAKRQSTLESDLVLPCAAEFQILLASERIIPKLNSDLLCDQAKAAQAGGIKCLLFQCFRNCPLASFWSDISVWIIDSDFAECLRFVALLWSCSSLLLSVAVPFTSYDKDLMWTMGLTLTRMKSHWIRRWIMNKVGRIVKMKYQRRKKHRAQSDSARNSQRYSAQIMGLVQPLL